MHCSLLTIVAVIHLVIAAPAIFTSPGNDTAVVNNTNISSSDRNDIDSDLNSALGIFERKVDAGLRYLDSQKTYLRRDYNIAAITLSTVNRPPAHQLSDFNLIAVQVARPQDTESYLILDAGDGWKGPYYRPLRPTNIFNWDPHPLISYDDAERKLRDVQVRGPWTTVLLHLLPEDPFTGRETDEPFYAFYSSERPNVMTYVGAKTGRAISSDQVETSEIGIPFWNQTVEVVAKA